MLPINKLTAEAAACFKEHGVVEDDILAAFHLDPNQEGNFGDTWLALDSKRMRLCRADLSTNSYDEFELALLVNPYVDNFTTSNALLAYRIAEPLPPQGDMEKKEYEFFCEDIARKGKTEIVGFCTNACKRRLFAFVHIWEKTMKGETVTEDDPIFEQFNAKCPKCGTVYADQNRRICENCINKKGLIFRLLEYFKPFKIHLVAVLICLVLSSCVSLVSPIISGQLLYDQVIDTGDANVTVAYENGAIDLPVSDNAVLNMWNAVARKLYYYYEAAPDGEFALINGEYTWIEDASVLPEGTERYSMVLTHDKEAAAETTRITGMLHKKSNVYLVVALIVGLALFSLGIGIVQNRANATMSTEVTKNMKCDIYRAMSALSLSYFNQNPTGRLNNRVNYDAVKIRSFYIDGLPYLLVNVLNFVGLTIFLFSINWQLTLIVFVPIPIIIIIFRVMLPKLWRSYSRQWRRSSSMNSMMGDSLNGIRVVKAFAK